MNALPFKINVTMLVQKLAFSLIKCFRVKKGPLEGKVEFKQEICEHPLKRL